MNISRTKISKQKFPRGSALVFTLIILSVMLVAAIGISSVSVMERKNSSSTGKSTSSFQVADSGAEIILQKKKTAVTINDLVGGGVACDSEGTLTGDISGKKYAITMYDKDDHKLNCTNGSELSNKIAKIKSAGSYAGTSRAVEVEIPRSWILNANLSNEMDWRVNNFAVYDNKLYAASGEGPPNSKANVYETTNGSTWTNVFNDPSEKNIFALYPFNGKLYAGTGGDGKIYKYKNDGLGWVEQMNLPGASMRVDDFKEFNGKLYAGTGGAGNAGKIYVSSDGTNWNVAYTPATPIYTFTALEDYGGKLYAGGEGKIYVYDGAGWSVAYSTAYTGIPDMAVFKGKLYVSAMTQSGADCGTIYEYDGTTWKDLQPTVAGMPLARYRGLAAFDDGKGEKLYIGAGSIDNGGGSCDPTVATVRKSVIYTFDGSVWKEDYDVPDDLDGDTVLNIRIPTFVNFNGILYAGSEEGEIYNY